VENTRQADTSSIEVFRPVARGENVIQVGEDMARGEALLSRGSLIRPQDIGALLSLGITRVPVFQRVRVALIPTGDELVRPEDSPGPGQIRNTNAYALAGLALQAGAIPLRLDIVRDSYEALREAIRKAMALADLVVVSAGSSVSTRDVTASAIGSLGQPGVLVHGVSIRPGKPTIMAVVDGKPVFGLPGNPASAMITFHLFVTPAIYTLSGCHPLPARRQIEARLTRNVPSAPGREDYVPVKIEERNGELYAEPVFGKSNLMFALVRADGVARIPIDRGGLAAGEMVTVRMF
jgi:molybdopterin molybdotransferase